MEFENYPKKSWKTVGIEKSHVIFFFSCLTKNNQVSENISQNHDKKTPAAHFLASFSKPNTHTNLFEAVLFRYYTVFLQISFEEIQFFSNKPLNSLKNPEIILASHFRKIYQQNTTRGTGPGEREREH